MTDTEEPVWLVRAVLVLFLVGFMAFLGREVQRLTDPGWTTGQLGWIIGAAVGLALVAALWAVARRRAA